MSDEHNVAKAPDALSTVETPENPEQIESWLNYIWQGECLAGMKEMPENSIDLILADLPYGTTRNKWDSIIPLEELWEAYKRVLKPDGCVVLTSAQPFTSTLVLSNPEWFRYEWIWSKTIGSGQLNTTHQPLRTHESVLVFAPKKPRYNTLMEVGDPYTAVRKADDWTGRGYNNQIDHTAKNSGYRHPKSVLLVPNPRIKKGHPTQKPVELFDYLIKTYTNPGDIVLDNVMGSGTTAISAIRTGRNYIGFELDEEYAKQSRVRIGETLKENDFTIDHQETPFYNMVVSFPEFTSQMFNNSEQAVEWIRQTEKQVPALATDGVEILFAHMAMNIEDPADKKATITVFTNTKAIQVKTKTSGNKLSSEDIIVLEETGLAELKFAPEKTATGFRATIVFPTGTTVKIPVLLRDSEEQKEYGWGNLPKLQNFISF